MRVVEAKELVIDLMTSDLGSSNSPVVLDPHSPDPRDPGKFVLDRRVARAVHHYNGWFLPIDLGWFRDGYDEPRVQGSPFHWYVFAVPRRRRYVRDHYLVCDYLQIRKWVLDFAAPPTRQTRNIRGRST